MGSSSTEKIGKEELRIAAEVLDSAYTGGRVEIKKKRAENNMPESK